MGEAPDPNTVIVDPREGGQKLLQFLQRRLDLPPSLLHRWIRTGQVRINGGRAKPFGLVAAGDSVRLPPFALGMSRRSKATGGQASPEQGHEPRPRAQALPPAPRPLQKDGDLWVFCKPAGLPTHPGTGHEDSLSSRLAAGAGDAPFKPTPVHRLDKDTSGILLVAADDITVDGAAVSGNLLVAPKAGEANLTVKNARLERDLRVSTHGATLTVADSQVEGDVALSGDRASLTLGSGAQLARLAVDGAGSSVSVKSGASVETLTARAAVKVDNQGAINKAEVQADNVVLDGKRPAHVEVADDVAPPQNSEGEEVTGSEDSQEPGQGGGGSGGGGGSVSEEAVAGIVGVRPVDQDGVEEDMPSVTAKATKKTGENFVRIALSTDGVVPIHQSEGAGKGAWVGVAIEAPEGYEQGTFQYHFGTEASAEATQSAAITEDSSIGQGKYAVFFLNASSTAPKTHITVKWEGQEAVQYVVDLSGVQTPAVKLTGVTVSTHEMPSGVSSTAEGLSFDGSTALVQNGGSGTLTHTQVASMGGGGEYTVYYTVPQAIPGGTLQFDKIARSVNGGKWNAWAMPSTTEANAGSGWWTRDGENYYFKWGAVFAEEAEGSYRLKDGGVFDYTLCFIDTDGSQDNIIATYTFQIDLSGYTITADE